MAVYRKGSLVVSIDLQKKILTWQESRQWCNNFVRSLSEEQVRDTIRILDEIDLHAENTDHGKEGEAASPHAPDGMDALAARHLRIAIQFGHSQISLDDQEIDPSAWQRLCVQIEKLSRMPFRL